LATGLAALSVSMLPACVDRHASSAGDVAHTEERARITYAIDAARPSPLPLVHGSVSGKPTLMVVDTGSGGTAIATWLARSLSLETTKTAGPTHDPSGRPVAMERYDTPHLVIDGFEPLPDLPTAVVDLPAPFESAGIGVILSPQALAVGDATVTLDLQRNELRRARTRGAAAAPAPSGGRFDIDRPVVCQPRGPSTFVDKRLTATAIIDGMTTVLEVDTGAFGSPLFVLADTDVGRKVKARPEQIDETGLSAAGRLDVVTAKDVPVHVGDRDRRASVTVMPGTRDAQCGVEGRLGLEWLRTCVFTIGASEYRLRCE
jgi:hypothetical protein